MGRLLGTTGWGTPGAAQGVTIASKVAIMMAHDEKLRARTEIAINLITSSVCFGARPRLEISVSCFSGLMARPRLGD